ncbi:snapalysin family zinc-dependent metalloprotease [Pseudonocardiaceae bacterium YIM PH 21723]|nr:snapalysin family zinc-dependent metalloprotease [Pseudonocardiaceae bacterium YIM PH 21723]
MHLSCHANSLHSSQGDNSMHMFKRAALGLTLAALPLAGVMVATGHDGFSSSNVAAQVGRVCIQDNTGGVYSNEVSQSISSVWNPRVKNVQLAACSGGITVTAVASHPSGSHYQGDMRGHGSVVIDRSQVNQGYLPLRVVAHEIGHGLGLYDNYSGPCSELMSGGGPGTSCKNAYPNAAEVNQVNQIWAGSLRNAGPGEVTLVFPTARDAK